MADILCFDGSATRKDITGFTERLVVRPHPRDPFLRMFVFSNLSKAIAVLGKREFDAIVVTLGTPSRSPSGYPVIDAANRLGHDAPRFVVTTHPAWALQETFNNAGVRTVTVIQPDGAGLAGIARAVMFRLPVGTARRPNDRVRTHGVPTPSLG